MSVHIPAVIIGASGYVGGELLRLIAGHPVFSIAAAVSDSVAGKPIGDVFGHLATAFAERRFHRARPLGRSGSTVTASWPCSRQHRTAHRPPSSQTRSSACESRNIDVHVVDSSADFRFARQEDWEAVYQATHGAPQLLDKFVCAVPEHVAAIDVAHVGHPGCFATASTLATVPLIQSGLTEAEVFISGITGSTGSGKSPQAGTHHPVTKQQPVCLQAARPPARAGSRGACRARERSRDKGAFRAAFRAVRARHSRYAAGKSAAARDRGTAAQGLRGRLWRRAVCAGRQRYAADQERRRQQPVSYQRRDRWRHRRRHERPSTTWSKALPVAPCNG